MKIIWKVDGGEFCSKTYYFNRFGAVFAGVKVLRISESGIATEQRLELQCELGRVLFPLESVGIGSVLKGSAGVKK